MKYCTTAMSIVSVMLAVTLDRKVYAASEATPAFTLVQPALFADSEAFSNSWADYDGDGDQDLMVLFMSGQVRLYENQAGRFSDVGPLRGLPVKGEWWVLGAAWGDYDKDGDIDVYLGYKDGLKPASNRLYRNDGGKRFQDVTEEVGLARLAVNTRQSSWVDVDSDGDLDLFVPHKFGFNALYENVDGRFSDISRSVGLFDPRRTLGSCWFDMDEDGDLDTFNTNQYGDRNAFYRNDGGSFVDIAAEYSMDKPGRHWREGSVSCSAVDYDNDGDLDLFVNGAGTEPINLYRNEGKGRFIDVTESVGLVVGENSGIAAGIWGDYDLDGRIDLYLANGFGADYLFKNTAGGFHNVFSQLIPGNAGRGETHAAQWADFDQDGDLDLALASINKPGGHPLLRNEMPVSHRSLQITILDRDGHYTKAGTEVRLFDAATGQLLGTRLVDAGTGYNTQNATPLHFGLAKMPKRVDVEVTSISPSGRQVKSHKNIEPEKFRGKTLKILVN